MTGGGRTVLRWTGAAVGLVAAALAVLHPSTAWWLRREERAWKDEDSHTRPRGAPDATARSLIDLARPLGIELQVFRSSDPELSPVVAFVEAQRRSDSDDAAGPTPAVLELLSRYEPHLRAIESLLAGAAPPAWPEDPERPFDSPRPPVLGLRTLNALLVARAAERDRAGDAAGTERALLASTRLTESLQDRAETLAQLGTAALAGERAGVLRLLVHPPTGSAARLGAHDFRGPFLASYRMEARLATAYARSRRFSWRELTGQRKGAEASGLRRAADHLLATPFARLCAADTSRRLRGLVSALQTADPCRVDTEALDAALARDLPRWNVVARTALQLAANRWTAVRDLELEEELTRIVLEIRAEPPDRQDVIASRVCGGLVWRRSPDGKGAVSVEPVGLATEARSNGAPWRYRVAAPVRQR